MEERGCDVVFDSVGYTYPEGPLPIFTKLTLQIPSGVVSFIGQNGVGKSTVLLLASARIYPDSGTVSILGRDSDELTDETEKNRYVSFIYQNMEFETEERIGALMEWVYEHGFTEARDPALVGELARVLELEGVLHKRTGEVSKGELQRAIIGFSLLYGSKMIMMDEPIFALEDRQKERVMDYLRGFARDRSISIYYSVHELDISRKYSDWVLLFYKDRSIRVGPTAEMLAPALLEAAYEFPPAMLHQKEHLYREALVGRRRPMN